MEEINKECLLNILNKNIDKLERGLKSSLHYCIDKEVSIYIYADVYKKNSVKYLPFLGNDIKRDFWIRVSNKERIKIDMKEFINLWDSFLNMEREIAKNKELIIVDKIKNLCR